MQKLPLLIFVNKGIEISTQALTLEIIADTCGAKVAKVATFIVSATDDVHVQRFYLAETLYPKSQDHRLPKKVRK